MGMFDTFIPKDPVLCPSCSAPIEDFQTKALAGELQTIREGKEFHNIVNGLDIRNGNIPVYQYCDSCSKQIYAIAVIEEWKFTSIELMNVETLNLLSDEERRQWGRAYGQQRYQWKPQHNSSKPAITTILGAFITDDQAEAFIHGFASGKNLQVSGGYLVESDNPEAPAPYHLTIERDGVDGSFLVISHSKEPLWPCPVCKNPTSPQLSRPPNYYEYQCSFCNTVWNLRQELKDEVYGL